MLPFIYRYDVALADLVVYFEKNTIVPFETKAEWRKYFSQRPDMSEEEETPEQRRKRYEHEGKMKSWVEVPVEAGTILLHALRHSQFVVPAVPTFNIFVRNNGYHKNWLKDKTIKQLKVVDLTGLVDKK